MIHVGFSKGQSVDIDLVHTIVAAQTRYGKSTTIRAMMQYIPDDYRALCLDVKDPRDFEGAGTEVPIYVENKTDPLMLKQLLEQESHLWLRKEFPELIDLCKEGDPFSRVLERVDARMQEKVHPVVLDRLKVLRLLLKNLVENMAKVEMSDRLELPAKNNVMNLSKAPSAIKQLAVYSVVKWALERMERVVLIIDELPDFAPQGFSTPSKSMIGQAIRKGGAKGIWLWLSGQTMTGVDKQVLKQAMIWILGHQREINEAKRTLEQIPFKTGLDVKDIMTLPRGQFVVCTDEGAFITFVQAEGVDAELAIKVSLGQETVDDVTKLMNQVKVMKSDEMYKELYEQEKHKREECEKEFARQLEVLSKRAAEETAKQKDEEWKKKLDIEVAGVIDRFSKEKATLEIALKQLEPLRAFREAFIEAFGPFSVATEITKDITVTGVVEGPRSISLADVDERINQRLSSGPTPIPVVSVDVDARIKELVKNEVVQRIVTKIKELPDPAKKAAYWLHENKTTNVRALYNYVFDRPIAETGRIPGTFYMNVVNPLVDAWLIVNDAGSIRWVLKDKLANALNGVITDDDLEKVPKYLVSLLL
jgi:hypothetical protein